MSNQADRAPLLHALSRAPGLLLLAVLAAVLTACSAPPTASEPTVTAVATVAPNSRALPDETTVIEAAPSVATVEAAATVATETEEAAQAAEPETPVPADDEQPAATPFGTATPERPEVRVSELATYTGRSVAVRGTISERLGEHALLLNDPTLLDEEQRVLVIYDQVDVALEEEQLVLISGEVRPFDLGEIEESTGLDLPDEQIISNQTDPVLIADSITRVP